MLFFPVIFPLSPENSMNFRGTRRLPSKIAGAPDQRSKKNRASPYFLWISARLSSPIFSPTPGPLRFQRNLRGRPFFRFLWNRKERQDFIPSAPQGHRKKKRESEKTRPFSFRKRTRRGKEKRDRGPRGRFSTADEGPFSNIFPDSFGKNIRKRTDFLRFPCSLWAPAMPRCPERTVVSSDFDTFFYVRVFLRPMYGSGKKNPLGTDRRSVPRVFLSSHKWVACPLQFRRNWRGRSSAVENRPLGPRSLFSFPLRYFPRLRVPSDSFGI